MTEPVGKLIPMSPSAFKEQMKARNMTGRALAVRWVNSEAWISKIINDTDRDPHWDDAIVGVQDDAAKFAPVDLKVHIKQRGWTGRALSRRWGKSETWISKIINDQGRDQDWDDAFRGLPLFQKAPRKRATKPAKTGKRVVSDQPYS